MPFLLVRHQKRGLLDQLRSTRTRSSRSERMLHFFLLLRVTPQLNQRISQRDTSAIDIRAQSINPLSLFSRLRPQEPRFLQSLRIEDGAFHCRECRDGGFCPAEETCGAVDDGGARGVKHSVGVEHPTGVVGFGHRFGAEEKDELVGVFEVSEHLTERGIFVIGAEFVENSSKSGGRVGRIVVVVVFVIVVVVSVVFMFLLFLMIDVIFIFSFRGRRRGRINSTTGIDEGLGMIVGVTIAGFRCVFWWSLRLTSLQILQHFGKFGTGFDGVAIIVFFWWR